MSSELVDYFKIIVTINNNQLKKIINNHNQIKINLRIKKI